MRITEPISATLCSVKSSSCIVAAVSAAGVDIGAAVAVGEGRTVSSTSSGAGFGAMVSSGAASVCAAEADAGAGAGVCAGSCPISFVSTASAGSCCCGSDCEVAAGANSIASAGVGAEQAQRRKKHNMSSIPCNSFNAFTTNLASKSTLAACVCKKENDRIRACLSAYSVPCLHNR